MPTVIKDTFPGDVTLAAQAGVGVRAATVDATGKVGNAALPAVGPGTVNTLARFTGAAAVGDSGVTDDGTTVRVPTRRFRTGAQTTIDQLGTHGVTLVATGNDGTVQAIVNAWSVPAASAPTVFVPVGAGLAPTWLVAKSLANTSLVLLGTAANSVNLTLRGTVTWIDPATLDAASVDFSATLKRDGIGLPSVAFQLSTALFTQGTILLPTVVATAVGSGWVISTTMTGVQAVNVTFAGTAVPAQ